MVKTYKEERILKAIDCDLNGTWRPGAILVTMQEAGAAHSELLGAGYYALSQQDLAWVLFRAEVVMDRYPAIGDTVSTETFPMEHHHWFFPRYYIFRDQKGAEIGRSATLWALMNLKTRRMVTPEAVTALMPDNSDLPAPLALPGPVQEVSGTLETDAFRPVYTDFDSNRHVNNTKYVDWCCNALGVEAMTGHGLRRFSVSYNQEVRAGETVRTELRRLGDTFSYCGFLGDKRCFDIGGELMELG